MTEAVAEHVGATYTPRRPQRGVYAFVEGFSTPMRGMRFMAARPRLWKYGWLPVLCNLLITLLVLAGAIALLWWFHTSWDPAWFGWAWADWIAELLVGVVAVLVVLLLAAITWLILEGILCGYFYSLLAEQVERELGVAEGELYEVPILYQAVDTVRDVSSLALIMLGCLAAQLLPCVGSVLGLIVAMYFNWIIFGKDTLDHPLALRGMRWKQKIAFIREHRLHSLGLGAAVFLMMLLPVIGAVFATTAVTGGVMLHRDLTADRSVDVAEPTM